MEVVPPPFPKAMETGTNRTLVKQQDQTKRQGLFVWERCISPHFQDAIMRHVRYKTAPSCSISLSQNQFNNFTYLCNFKYT